MIQQTSQWFFARFKVVYQRLNPKDSKEELFDSVYLFLSALVGGYYIAIFLLLNEVHLWIDMKQYSFPIAASYLLPLIILYPTKSYFRKLSRSITGSEPEFSKSLLALSALLIPIPLIVILSHVIRE